MKNSIAIDRDWLDLSLAQQAVWLDAKLSGNMVLQLGGWARIPAPLEEGLVRQAVSLVMARHDALRLRVDDEQPRQWMDSSTEAPLTVITLSDIGDVDDAFQHHLKSSFMSSMLLGDHPLLRIELIRIGDSLSYLIWHFHHLIADSVSTTLTMQYWTEAYLALTADEPPQLAARSSYLQVIESDREYLASRDYKQDLTYWIRRFDPLPPVLIAEMHRAHEAASDFFADWILMGEAWELLGRAIKGMEVSPSRVLFAIFAMTLAERYAQLDIVVGIALHRRDPLTSSVLGMLSGVLAVRFCFAPKDSLLQAIQKFSVQIDADLRHQRMPADNLARSLGLFRRGRSRLFEVVMSFLPSDRVHNRSIDEAWAIESGVVAFGEASPISLHVTELDRETGFQIRVSVNPQIMDAAEARALLSLLQHAIGMVAHNANACLDDLFSKYLLEHAIVETKSNSDDDREEWII